MSDQTVQMLTVEEAAALLSIGRTSAFGLVRNGELRSVLIGTARRVPDFAIREFVAAQLAAVAAKPLTEETSSSSAIRASPIATDITSSLLWSADQHFTAVMESVVCPRCLALPGVACQTLTGNICARVHSPRARAAHDTPQWATFAAARRAHWQATRQKKATS